MSLPSPSAPACERRNVARLRRATVVSAVSGLCLSLSCLGGGLGGALGGGLAAHADDLRNQQSDLNAQLAATSEDIVSANAAVREAQLTVLRVSRDLPGAQAALGSAQSQLAVARAEDDALAGRLKAAQVQLGITAHAVNAAAGVLAARRRFIGIIARAQYNGLDLANVSTFFDAKQPSDLVEKAALVRSVLYSTNQIIGETAAAQAELEHKKATLDIVTQQISGLRDQSAAALAKVQQIYTVAASAESKVAGLVADRQHALAVAADYLAEVRRKYEQLQAKSAQIQAELAARGQTSGPGVPGKGGLLWPANGPKTSDYGYRVDPYSGRRQLHAGIDIGASMGSPIYAARAGVVALVETVSESGGYGNYTCIDHGSGFATCYAHQSAILVSNGEAVAQGTVIGRVGSTGYSTGPHLHFETRINGNPVDPMQYY